MNAAWLVLLAFLPMSRAAEVEALDKRSYVEATPEFLARRAKSCRADVEDYRKTASLELMQRLIVCLEHPDPAVLDTIIDNLPERRLWDRQDYETAVKPQLQEVVHRFQKYPNDSVRTHTGQLEGFLINGEQWRDRESPQAQERRRRESEAQSHHDETHWPKTPLQWLGLAAIVAFALFLRSR
jgi:hypothetical protein